MPTATDELVTLRARIIKRIWEKPDKSWSIAVVHILDDKDSPKTEATVVGSIPLADRDEILELIGTWENRPNYGRQLKVRSCAKVIPISALGLKTYLAKEIDGIGPERASRLIDAFGNDLPYIIEHSVSRLSEIKGISESIAQRIATSWQFKHKERQVALFLAHADISTTWSAKVLEALGDKAIDVLRHNPYLLTKVDGLSFFRADIMAKKLGFPPGPERSNAAVIHVLKEALEQGHTCLPVNELIQRSVKAANISVPEVEAAIKHCVSSKSMILDTFQVKDGQLIEVYYLPIYHKLEVDLSKRIKSLLSKPYNTPTNLETIVAEVEESFHINLAPKQREAIVNAFTDKVSIITGGPGVGKTTIIKALVQVASKLGISYGLAAPTGRAAKRLSEITGQTASTIHRLLEYTHGSFNYNAINPLPVKFIIIDEFSMVDLATACALFEALDDNCVVVAVGDIDQLPAVGSGAVLKDMIRSKKIPSTRLDTVFRQAEDSLIISNAHRILKGEAMRFPPKGSTAKADSYLIPVQKTVNEEGKSIDNIEWLQNMLSLLVKEHLPKKLGINPVRDIQVIAPMKKGTGGVAALNGIMQEILNPVGEEVEVSGNRFRIGDRLMQRRNNYEINVYNGDIGFLKSIDWEEKQLVIDFGGEDAVKYPFEDASDLRLAYAITVHKSQGSEYPVVINIFLTQHFVMLERNLLYTANTRAKKMALFLSDESALAIAARNQNASNRFTFLAQRIYLEAGK